MNPENKKDASKDFGRVVDVLHNKNKLASLRSYQGDMAEFIKSKDESVISIAVKEKERKEQKAEEVKQAHRLIPQIETEPKSKSSLQINFTMLILSTILIGGGVLASFFIYEFIQKEPRSELTLNEEIIPYNNSVTLANVTQANFVSELAKLNFGNGVSIIKVSDVNGLSVEKAKDFFSFLNIAPPPTLLRTLKDQYVIGALTQAEEYSYFMIIKVNDFGGAFSAMLEWEKNISKDLAFLNPSISGEPVSIKPEVFVWKDLIIKNKDIRGLVNDKNKSEISYTFLDKNTILITGNLSVIGEMVSTYASRAFTR